ncbi:L-histidine N(alpha)-methyltransferase [Pigmentiphaga aceris]|uniref:L-histidine N(Alpha)-methyltransferase n=1 Tax=Pigmentiphaga aceris TaxID=1940612 RepID=A0A5C0AUC8_9BURK|nr:L-histidine N(alpha)-methyltransferase [Pigmentiphaga aceris]QEI05326.1 L-histidine N(alpha)-methyltransferase [Pigmentiphaga aceris]
MSSLLFSDLASRASVDGADAPRELFSKPASRLGDERSALRNGLLAAEASIDPKYFYDAQGCVLFSAICELAEYYPTRLERHIFDTYREDIQACLPSNLQWIDLGCGDCLKSQRWLSTLPAQRYVGIDIAEEWLQQSVDVLRNRFPAIDCMAVTADFTRDLSLQEALGDVDDLPPVFFYPGSSIGNFARPRAISLLASIRRHLGEHGRLLISVDLRKDPQVMEAAYDDAIGVTAAFNKNILRAANRELGSDFHPEHFEHRAIFDDAASRIEMQLIARHKHDVDLGEGARRQFQAGEIIVTEHSYKYTPEHFGDLLAGAGLSVDRMWTDERGWFGVFLARA